MPKAFSVSSFVVSTLCLIGWPAHAVTIGSAADAPTSRFSLGKIRVSANLCQTQYETLAKDLAFLRANGFTSPDPRLLTTLQIDDASPATLIFWLEERIHYLIDESYNPVTHLKSYVPFKNYVNPNIFPDIEESPVEADIDPSLQNANLAPRFNDSTMMKNLGSELYLISKREKSLATFEIPGAGDVMVTSPRVGMITVSQGLLRDGMDSFEPGSRVHVAFRLSNLFHEARHSDGNGKSLSFAHAVCPAGALKGLRGCDRNLNGPYAVDAYFLSSFVRSCKDCTPAEREVIRILALDSASRIIRETVPPSATDTSNQDARALRAIYRQIHSCEEALRWDPSPEGMDCSQLNQKRQEAADLLKKHPDLVLTPSVDWDPTPEGAL